eukprot:5711647-Amphidinium_carterae.1
MINIKDLEHAHSAEEIQTISGVKSAFERHQPQMNERSQTKRNTTRTEGTHKSNHKELIYLDHGENIETHATNPDCHRNRTEQETFTTN